MPNYNLAYYGEPKFDNPEEGSKSYARWQAWMAGLGDAIVNVGTPLGNPMTVSADGVTDSSGSGRLTGFSVVKADSIEAALEMAKACPYIEYGTIDVAEILQM